MCEMLQYPLMLSDSEQRSSQILISFRI